MAKTNFSKAEESMMEAMQKMTMQQLLELADAHAGNLEELSKRTRVRTMLITTLKHDLKRLYRTNPDIYKKFHVKKKELERWLAEAANLSEATGHPLLN